jgi:hypothetical protein
VTEPIRISTQEECVEQLKLLRHGLALQDASWQRILPVETALKALGCTDWEIPCTCPNWALARNGRGCHAAPCLYAEGILAPLP